MPKCTIYIPIKINEGSTIFIFLTSTFYYLSFLIIAIPAGIKWHLIVFLTCICLITNDVKHIFIYLLAIHISSLDKQSNFFLRLFLCLWDFVALLWCKQIGFFLFILWGILWASWICKLVSVISLGKIFSFHLFKYGFWIMTLSLLHLSLWISDYTYARLSYSIFYVS